MIMSYQYVLQGLTYFVPSAASGLGEVLVSIQRVQVRWELLLLKPSCYSETLL